MYEKQKATYTDIPRTELEDAIEYWQKKRDERLTDFVFAEITVNDMKAELETREPKYSMKKDTEHSTACVNCLIENGYNVEVKNSDTFIVKYKDQEVKVFTATELSDDVLGALALGDFNHKTWKGKYDLPHEHIEGDGKCEYRQCQKVLQQY